MNVVEGALFLSSAAFISHTTVLPALVTRLGGGNVAVGAVGVIVWLGLFLPQIFAARFVATRQWKKPWAVQGGIAQRIVLLLIGVVILTLGDTKPAVALWLFLLLLFVNQVLLGIITPGWLDLIAKLTPVNRRGRLVGIRNSFGGALGFGCGAVLTWLFATWNFPTSYALAFFCAFSLQLAAVVVQLQLIEPEPSVVAERGPVSAFWGQLAGVFAQDKAFKEFVYSLVFLTIAIMPVGFFTVYALNRFGGDEGVVGEFTLALVAAQVVSALLNGFVADRYGNKTTLSVAAGGLFCASLTALLAPTLAWFRLVFVFLGVHLGSELMSRYNMSIEYGPPEHRSIYVGMMNTFLAPLYLSGMVGGWISDRFGYPAVFAVGAVSSLIGITLLIVRVRDPRVVRVPVQS